MKEEKAERKGRDVLDLGEKEVREDGKREEQGGGREGGCDKRTLGTKEETRGEGILLILFCKSWISQVFRE